MRERQGRQMRQTVDALCKSILPSVSGVQAAEFAADAAVDGDSEEQLYQRKPPACRVLPQSTGGVLVCLDFAVHIILRQCVSRESFLKPLGYLTFKLLPAFEHPFTEVCDITTIAFAEQFLTGELLVFRR